jgi:hypothetical protein
MRADSLRQARLKYFKLRFSVWARSIHRGWLTDFQHIAIQRANRKKPVISAGQGVLINLPKRLFLYMYIQIIFSFPPGSARCV